MFSLNYFLPQLPLISLFLIPVIGGFLGIKYILLRSPIHYQQVDVCFSKLQYDHLKLLGHTRLFSLESSGEYDTSFSTTLCTLVLDGSGAVCFILPNRNLRLSIILFIDNSPDFALHTISMHKFLCPIEVSFHIL